MKPKRIILIRHGESEGNVDPHVYGKTPDYALKLTPNGHLQAQECGKQLKALIKNEGPYRTHALHFIPETSFTLFGTQKDRPLVQL